MRTTLSVICVVQPYAYHSTLRGYEQSAHLRMDLTSLDDPWLGRCCVSVGKFPCISRIALHFEGNLS